MTMHNTVIIIWTWNSLCITRTNVSCKWRQRYNTTSKYSSKIYFKSKFSPTQNNSSKKTLIWWYTPIRIQDHSQPLTKSFVSQKLSVKTCRFKLWWPREKKTCGL